MPASQPASSPWTPLPDYVWDEVVLLPEVGGVVQVVAESPGGCSPGPSPDWEQEEAAEEAEEAREEGEEVHWAPMAPSPPPSPVVVGEVVQPVDLYPMRTPLPSPLDVPWLNSWDEASDAPLLYQRNLLMHPWLRAGYSAVVRDDVLRWFRARYPNFPFTFNLAEADDPAVDFAGVTIFSRDEPPRVIVVMGYDPLSSFCTLLHELGHLVRHVEDQDSDHELLWAIRVRELMIQYLEERREVLNLLEDVVYGMDLIPYLRVATHRVKPPFVP